MMNTNYIGPRDEISFPDRSVSFCPTRLLMRRSKKGPRSAGGKVEMFRRTPIRAGDEQGQCVIDSLSRLLLVTVSETSRAPKFETWLWTLIIIKSQTGNFQTMSC